MPGEPGQHEAERDRAQQIAEQDRQQWLGERVERDHISP